MPTSDESLKNTPKVLIAEARLQARIAELAQEISADYRGKEIVAICVLKGSFIFFADLIRKLDLRLSCEFLAVTSYGNKMISSGEVKMLLDVSEPLEGKHVIVFEDIVDSGLSLSYVMNTLKARRPASIKSCTLLFKPEALKTELDIDYTGFRIGNEFVVGFGLDYAGKFRGLPYVGYLEHEH